MGHGATSNGTPTGVTHHTITTPRRQIEDIVM
jgi:hypothetical protein